MNYFTSINEKESKEIIPGFFAYFIHTENVTSVFGKQSFYLLREDYKNRSCLKFQINMSFVGKQMKA